MSPTLRSSAPSTPVGKKSSETTPSSSTRKTPCCTKCHRPRAGHPRQGCPYVDSPSAPTQTQRHDLSEALGSLYIEQPKEEAVGRSRRSSKLPEPSLASLSTDASAIVNRLLQPGIMDDTSNDGDACVQQWQKGVETPTKAHRRLKEGRMMPGTLGTPNSSFLPTEPSSSQDTAHVNHASKSEIQEDVLSTRATIPLVRSLSVEERKAFLDGIAEISKAPPATVYVLPMNDMLIVQQSAMKLGFCTRVVAPTKGSQEVDGLLIIGKDSLAVEKLFGRLARDVKKGMGMRAVNAAAGGAVVGAVATFTGLAFA